MVQLWHLCLQRWCTSEFFSHTAGYQQMLCPAQGTGCRRADCSSAMRTARREPSPMKLASLSGASYTLRTDGYFLEKDWKRLRDQKPSHLYLDISLSLYSLLFGFFTISQSSVCWWHLTTIRSCISYFVWEIHWFNFQSNSMDFWALWVSRSAPVWKGHKCWSQILWSSPHFLNSLVFD